MMKVLLVNPPRIINKGNIWERIDRALPPLGLAYIAAYLEKCGHEICILDLQAEFMIQEQVEDVFKKYNPEFIAVGSTTVEIEGALDIAKLAKKVFPGGKVVLGGVHPSIMTEEVLSCENVDFVVRGEGEYTLEELVSGKSKITDILGLSYKDEGIIKHNKDRPLIENLDEMPMPAYHLLPISKYKPSLGNYKRMPAMTMIATRGCPGRCTFCYTGIAGKKTRTRSADLLLDEIKYLQREFNIKEISFYDDTFTSFKDNVKKLCEGIIRENIDVTWSCMSRIDHVDEELLKLMKKAGCHQIGYGIESASSEILKNIRKPISIKVVEDIVRLTQKVGIDVRAMFMFGNPGETEETISQTIDFSIKLNPEIAVFNITTPFPGTEMYNWAKENTYLLNLKWSEFDLANIVMDLPTISQDRLRFYYHDAYKKFYTRPRYLLKRLFKIRTFLDLKNNMKSMMSILSLKS